MKRKRDNLRRIIAIAAFYVTVCLVYIGRLLYLQVSGQDYYTMSTPVTYFKRTEKIAAQRGEIFDRNGKPLVTNEYKNNILLDYASLEKSKTNDLILEVYRFAEECGDEDSLTTPRSALDTLLTDAGITFTKPDGFSETARGRKYAKLVSELGTSEEAGANDEARDLMVYFDIMTKEYNKSAAEYEYYYNYTYDVAEKLFTVRLDMALSDFSAVSPYTLAEDVSLSFVTKIEEKITRGIVIETSAERVYNYPGYATHILGLVRKVPSDKVDYYTERGYSLDAKVGISGVEKVFEDYLRGTDGVLTITEDEYGNIVSTEVTTPPQAGHDVYLTIDIDLQITAENGLAENIAKIREEGMRAEKPLSGEDASKGAVTVADVSTGEVLALCSYPTYNLATFSRDYAELSSNEDHPLVNRALQGTYAPGSTFKVGVAVAALNEEIIDKDTIINAQGVYTYYEASGFTPRCWIYLSRGEVHGPINVVEAIKESCNYFFYDVGRRLTIEKMNEYSRSFGLGLPTGIELGEESGILAGPDYRNENGLDRWSPGDTIQAAIGQSDNLFTPMQITMYISTILNCGTRYSAHLLYKVCEFGTNNVIYESSPQVLSKINISDEIISVVKEGMKGVMDNGSAASVFSDYAIPVGGKTGTAQVSASKSDNGIMTAFAPFENPEIVVTSIIEQASGGTEAGYVVRDIFDRYFGVDNAKETENAENGENGENDAGGF